MFNQLHCFNYPLASLGHMKTPSCFFTWIEKLKNPIKKKPTPNLKPETVLIVVMN